MDYYKRKSEEVLTELNASREGLTTEEVTSRLEQYGLNEIAQKDRRSILSLFIESFKDPMVIVLLIVAIIQILIGETLESLIIFTVLILNSLLSVGRNIISRFQYNNITHCDVFSFDRLSRSISQYFGAG